MVCVNVSDLCYHNMMIWSLEQKQKTNGSKLSSWLSVLVILHKIVVVCCIVHKSGTYCFILPVYNRVLLCACPCRWQSIFNLRIWNSLRHLWNKVFLTMIIILIVLFLGKWNIKCVRFFFYTCIYCNLKLGPAHWPVEIVWTGAFRNINNELRDNGGFGKSLGTVT